MRCFFSGTTRPGPLAAAAAAAWLLLAGCPGSREAGDAGQGLLVEAGTDGAISQLLCTNDCRDLVVDRILLPTTAAEASKYGLILGGKSYNGLGTIISLISPYTSAGGLQQDVDRAVYKGDTLALLRLQAADLQDSPTARAQAWGGSSSCCKSSDLATCKSEAQASCFSGTSVIQKASGSPENMVFAGSISGGQLKLKADQMQLEIKIQFSSTLKLTLMQAQLTGKVTSAGITDGVLAGAVPQSVLQNTLVPELAKLLDSTYKDSGTDKKTRDLIKQLADTDGDGSISSAEVAANPLIANLLAGDVDVDSDGKKELSLGIGLSAVPCVIAEFKGF